MSRRTMSLLFAVLLAVLSIVAFINAVIQLHRGDYAHATFDLVLGFGLQWQARERLDRIP